jgi:hypothetical protein
MRSHDVHGVVSRAYLYKRNEKCGPAAPRPQSKSWRKCETAPYSRSVLDCASPLAPCTVPAASLARKLNQELPKPRETFTNNFYSNP